MLEYKITKELQLSDKIIWDDLWKKHGKSFFSSSYWFESFSKTFNINTSVFYFSIEKDVICIIPFEVKKYGVFLQYLKGVGGKFQDKSNILINTSYLEYLNDILEIVYMNHNVILNEVEECFQRYISRKYPGKISSINPFIDLTADIVSQTKKRQWNSVTNKIKKNDFLFDVSFNQVETTNPEILWRIEQESNKMSNGRAIFDDQHVRYLFTELLKHDETVLAVLYYEKIPISYILGYVIGGEVFMAHHMTFNQNFEKLQPGKVILVRLLKYLKDKKFICFDFSRGETLFKKQFSVFSVENKNLYLFRGSKNVLVILFLYLESFIKRFKRFIKVWVLRK